MGDKLYPPAAKSKGRPRKNGGVRGLPKMTVRAPPDLWMAVNADATMRGMSANDWIILAMTARLESLKTN